MPGEMIDVKQSERDLMAALEAAVSQLARRLDELERVVKEIQSWQAAYDVAGDADE